MRPLRLNLRRSLAPLAMLLAAMPATAAIVPAACPPSPVRVVRSVGGTIDYRGTVPGLPDLCRLTRADGPADYYFGVWRTDWPGAGDAYPALVAVVRGAPGTRVMFITRSWPGFQFKDSFTNAGTEPVTVRGRTYTALKLQHEREGYDGNTYHSIITNWRDVATGISLRTQEDQISGQSYGPATTWVATGVEPLPNAP